MGLLADSALATEATMETAKLIVIARIFFISVLLLSPPRGS
jgi:hypothetical protein